MNSIENIRETAISGVLTLIVVAAIFSWAAENDPGGPFSFLFDPLGTTAAWALDPSVVLLLLAGGFVWTALSSDGF